MYFSEAVKIANGAYYVRFYYEGVNGENAPYRTRVTETWVKEMGKWVRKTSHFSSAAYGGVHQTSKAILKINFKEKNENFTITITKFFYMV